MRELKQNYTIVIVTHNMQQAARASDVTAFLTMGEDRAGYLVEMAPTERAVHAADEPADRGLHHRPVRLRGERPVMEGQQTSRQSTSGHGRRSTAPWTV